MGNGLCGLRHWGEAVLATRAGDAGGSRWSGGPSWAATWLTATETPCRGSPHLGHRPGVVAPFERRVRDAGTTRLVQFRFRHRVDEVLTTDGVVDGVRGAVLAPSDAQRGTRSSVLQRQIVARDREMDNSFTKDFQVMAIHNARKSLGERLARTAAPHKILDPRAGPFEGSTLRARSPGSAAAVCTVTARWRAPSWAGASSPDARPGGPSPGLADHDTDGVATDRAACWLLLVAAELFLHVVNSTSSLVP
jgi:FAD binding domain